MANPTMRIHNAETDEIIDREMTADEFIAYQASKAAQLAREDAAAKEAAALKTATAKLTALGLTAADLKALGL